MTSRISGSCKPSPEERLNYLRKSAKLTKEEIRLLSSSDGLSLELADRMVENVIGFIPIPLGIVSGFIVNGKEYVMPMATEQKSIISMVARGAELTRTNGGFKASSTGSTMIGQIQLVKVHDVEKAKRRIMNNKEKILQEANTQSRNRRALDVQVRSVDTSVGRLLVVELLVDVKDSMGANAVNSMCEAAAPLIASLTGGKVNLRTVSNLATRRLVHVETVVSKNTFEGIKTIDQIVKACAFAENDPFRAATHNKGIMNGISAVLMATNNDTRAVEAGAHAYAAMTGKYRPLSIWQKNKEGDLIGKLTMPMAVGTVGGSISSHPTARIALKILGVKTATELGELAASTGLAYNLAVLEALVTKGIKSI